jgi:hypothetical protein
MGKPSTTTKQTKPKPPNSTDNDFDNFDGTGLLIEESQKFCKSLGLDQDLVLKIYKSDSDWVFLLRIDALLEAACKEVIRHGMRIKIMRETFQNELLDDFVDSLPMNGRTSLLKLLEASGFPDEERGFIEAVRRARNVYAHNIRFSDVSLIDLIKGRGDKSFFIKNLSAIKTYKEADLISQFEKDPKFLRFQVLDSAMRVLFYAYHMAVKKGPRDPNRTVTYKLDAKEQPKLAGLRSRRNNAAV